jgi:hypothetical protein
MSSLRSFKSARSRSCVAIRAHLQHDSVLAKGVAVVLSAGAAFMLASAPVEASEFQKAVDEKKSLYESDVRKLEQLFEQQTQKAAKLVRRPRVSEGTPARSSASVDALTTASKTKDGTFSCLKSYSADCAAVL